MYDPKELREKLSKLSVRNINPTMHRIFFSDDSSFVFTGETPCPERCHYDRVPSDDPFMRAADEARLTSGCFKQQTGAVIVKNGNIVATGANEGELQTYCEREKLGCRSGEGYEHCKTLCKQLHHAERCAIDRALSQGIDLTGSVLYLSGHWWACELCWKWCLSAGITRIVLDEKASEKFTKPASLFAK